MIYSHWQTYYLSNDQIIIDDTGIVYTILLPFCDGKTSGVAFLTAVM